MQYFDVFPVTLSDIGTNLLYALCAMCIQDSNITANIYIF